MNRFEMLISVLDGIRREAPEKKYGKLYAKNANDPEAVWQARSRAYIHLYLKVMFGLRHFEDREILVTDGCNVGGVDGYYVDINSKTVFFLQAKFRSNQDNFENKNISLHEILQMQVRRILLGEELDLNGQPYNGKIKGLQRALQELPLHMGPFKYKVVILANLEQNLDETMLKRLSDGYVVDRFDYKRAYVDLMMPVLSGNLFKAKDISISLDLSNKSAGAKIYYNIIVQGFDCSITLVFVPIIEIAKFMSEYQNSVLSYNPRSYLELAGAPVNRAIRETALMPESNDFALLNNGLTIICDRSSVTEESGVKNRPILLMINPQIINGGQTAYTLARIYDELKPHEREAAFAGKEVLVKAMALSSIGERDDEVQIRKDLIERISTATNNQTAVTNADRASTDDLRVKIQSNLFRRHGVLLENKRGEFSEGLKNGYLAQQDLVDRSLFQRLYFAANGRLNISTRRKVWKETLPEDAADNVAAIDRFAMAFQAWGWFREQQSGRNPFLQTMPKVYACLIVAGEFNDNWHARVNRAALIVSETWQQFLDESRLTNKSMTGLVAPVDDHGAELRGKRNVKTLSLAVRIAVFYSPLKLAN